MPAAGFSPDPRPAPAADGSAWEAEVGSVRLIVGAGRVGELGEEVGTLDVTRALLVTDRGIVDSGHAERAVQALEESGCAVDVFAETEVGPTTAGVTRALDSARSFRPDGLVAVGGGSVMDTTKGLNFLLTNGGTMEDYWGFGKARRPMLPAVAVPSTAGTGSDAQSFAVIARAEDGRRMACGDYKARFRIAILDPQVAVTVPRRVAAGAGIDALAHAAESLVSTRANPVSRLLSRQAWALLSRRIEACIGSDPSLEAFGDMLLGAHLAGAAIESSMLGAAHAAANPLSARFGVLHAEAIALMLPHVIRFNAETVPGRYDELSDGGAAAIAARVEEWRDGSELPSRLREVGVEREALPELALLATREWTGTFNPRSVAREEFLRLYEQAL